MPSAGQDDDEIDVDDAVDRQRNEQLSLAATARATLVGKSIRVRPSVLRSGDAGSVVAQPFQDEAFMSKVKEDSGAVDVGHIDDVALPAQIPAKASAPVEVANDADQKASLVPPAGSDPDKGTGDQRRACFSMAARAVLGLCTSDRADELEKQCVQVLAESFGIDGKVVDEELGALRDPATVAHLMRRDLKQRRARVAAQGDAFERAGAHGKWHQAQAQAMDEVEIATSEFASGPDQFIEEQRAAQRYTSKGDDDAHGEKGEDGDDDGVVYFWQLCCCCCCSGGGDDDKVEEEAQAAPDPPRQRRHVASVRDSLHPGANASFALGGGKDDAYAVDVEQGLIWVVIAMLRHLNKGTGAVISVKPSAVQKQEGNDTLWLTDECLFIVDSWCRRYGIGEAHRALVLLEFLTRRPMIASHYFWDALDLFDVVGAVANDGMLRRVERPALIRVATMTSSWCKACLVAYHDNFSGDLAYKGLGECIRLALMCHAITSANRDPPPAVVAPICQTALAARYEYVVAAAAAMEKNETRQRGAKDDDVVVARDTQKDAVVVVGAGAGPATGRRIRSSLHMIFVMQLLRKEVGNDVNAFGPVFEHEAGAGFSAVQTASSTYFPLVWADFRAFLSDATADIEVLRARYGNSPDALDPYIFKLYNELSDLYEFFAPHADLPDIVVGEHFAPFVDRWLEIQREHFSTTRIDSALNSDQWVALQDTKCTTSVIDLYAMLYPLADAFKSAPFSSEQSVTFAGLLSDIVCHYVHRLAVMLDADMTAWPGRVTDVMVLRFNDMHICKVKLSDLLKAIDLEKAYGKPPTLVDNDGQPGGGAGDDDAEFKAFMSDAIGGSSLDALRCSGSFRFMQDAMNGAAHKIAVPMNKLWSALITELVWRKPLTDAMDDDAVEAFLQPFWEDLAAKVEPLVAAMIEPHVLLRAFLAHLLVDVEGNLVPQSRKTVLNPAQLGRLRSAHQLMQEFFMFYGLPSNVLDAMKVNARATFLIQLQSGPTANLIGVWDAIPDDDESMPEEERIKAPPYLGRKHVRRILERRKRDAADPDADAFLKDHKKKGWF